MNKDFLILVNKIINWSERVLTTPASSNKRMKIKYITGPVSRGTRIR